jgi:hypothetical protein
MTKIVHDEVLDSALNYLKNNITHITVVGSTVTTYASATTQGADMLALVSVSASDFTGANGDASGRKITVGQKTGVEVSATGSAVQICLVDSSGAGKLFYVTEVSATQQLTDGNTMTFESWDIEIADPT